MYEALDLESQRCSMPSYARSCTGPYVLPLFDCSIVYIYIESSFAVVNKWYTRSLTPEAES